LNLNFEETLSTLYPGLSIVLIRSGILAAGGFLIIIVFGMLLFVFRVAGGAGSVVVIAVAIAVFLGLALTGLILQRFFLFRCRAAMLVLFSGRALPAPGPAAAIHESRNLFSNYSRWQALNLKLRRALFFSGLRSGQISEKPPPGGMRRLFDRLAGGILGQALMVLAFSRGETDIGLSAREGLALFSYYGAETRRRAHGWMGFSVAGLLILFLCLALPSWFIFNSAGAPVVVGIALAAIISGLLHQAFIAPFALAGVSAALLSETRDRIPDPELCEKLAALFPDATPAGER
jgi:hypothetical protein